MDSVLAGGLIVDGSGEPPFTGDIHISNGVIADIQPTGGSRADNRLDVSGLVVAPGFIDIHTHYDAQIIWDPLLEASTKFGVTTVVLGNCGYGVAPVRHGDPSFLAQLLARVEGIPESALAEGLPWSWDSFGSYLDFLDRPLGPNAIALVGHSALRYEAMGLEACERPATSGEVAAMQTSLREALESGAWGFSSSGSASHVDSMGRPAPSRQADLAEFAALATVVAQFDDRMVGVSPTTKLRGFDSSDQELLAVLSANGKISVNWNPLQWKRAQPDVCESNLALSERLAIGGGRVFAVYNPTTNGPMRIDLDNLFHFASLTHWKPLTTLSRREKLSAFRDPELRPQLKNDVRDRTFGIFTDLFDRLRITQTHAKANQPFEGRLVGEIARELQQDPVDVLLDVASRDELETCLIRDDDLYEDDDSLGAFHHLAQSPHVVFGGSDAGAHLDMIANQSLPVRTIEWRVRHQRSLPLEKAVQGYTAKVADVIGLHDRGRLAKGMAADIVVFDQDAVAATTPRPIGHLPGGGICMDSDAIGVHYTIVGGQIVFDHGHPSGNLSGRLLRGR